MEPMKIEAGFRMVSKRFYCHKCNKDFKKLIEVVNGSPDVQCENCHGRFVEEVVENAGGHMGTTAALGSNQEEVMRQSKYAKFITHPTVQAEMREKRKKVEGASGGTDIQRIPTGSPSSNKAKASTAKGAPSMHARRPIPAQPHPVQLHPAPPPPPPGASSSHAPRKKPESGNSPSKKMQKKPDKEAQTTHSSHQAASNPQHRPTLVRSGPFARHEEDKKSSEETKRPHGPIHPIPRRLAQNHQQFPDRPHNPHPHFPGTHINITFEQMVPNYATRLGDLFSQFVFQPTTEDPFSPSFNNGYVFGTAFPGLRINEFFSESDEFFPTRLGINLQDFGINFASNFQMDNLTDLAEVIAMTSEQPQAPSRPPASKKVVSRLPIFKIEEKHCKIGEGGKKEFPNCAVCCSSLKLGDKAMLIPCGHMYHPECIKPWLSQNNTCPVCRYELATDDPEYEERRAYAQE